MIEDYTLIGFGLAVIFGLIFAISDLKTMTIPNKLTAACFVVIMAANLIFLPFDEVVWRFAGAVIVMAVGVSLYFLKAGLGGGDVKAAAALAPLVTSVDAGVSLILLSLNGLIVTAVIFVARRLRSNPDSGWAVWGARGRIPYGLVLGLAAIQYTGLLALLSR
ncbi:MAG: prepilin peptidase [Pikeienuella sp.]